MFRRSRIGVSTLVVALGLAAMLGYILLAFKEFSDRCFEYTYAINEARLRELSAQNVDAVKIEFERTTEALAIFAAAFTKQDVIPSESTLAMLGRVQACSGFDRMWVVDGENRAYDKDGHTLTLPGREFLTWAREGKSGVYKVDRSSYTQGEVFCMYAPIPRDGKNGDVALGVCELASMVVRTDNPQFGGLGYTQVFDRSGRLIIKSQKPGALLAAENNIWNFFRTVEFGRGSNFENFYREVQSGGAGTISFRKGDQERIGHFAPIGVNDWFMLSSAPKSVVSSYSSSINSLVFWLSLKIVACFALLIAGIIFYSRRAHAAVSRVNSLLDISNQRFRVAAFHLSNTVIEYDIAGDVVYQVDDNPLSDAMATPIGELSAGLIKGCVIVPESLSSLRDVLERMRRGETYGACLLRAKREDGAVEWHHVVFTNVLDARGKPVRAIGTIENVTAQKETEIKFAHEERHREAMLAEVLETFVFNITRERFLYGYINRETHHFGRDPSYAKELDELIRTRVHPDYRETAAYDLSLERLRQSFEKGIARVESVFRGVDREDGENWLGCTVNMVHDPETMDLIGYAYIKDVTKSKLEELALKNEAERDALTGLYNRATANRLIERYIAETAAHAPESVNAFLLIDLDRFKYINDTHGHAAGDETLRLIAAMLGRIFRKSDIVGRMGGDEFVVFMKDAMREDLVRDKAAAVCGAMKEIVLSADANHRVSGSVGICLVPAHGIELTDIYAKADLALYAAKRDGKDRFRMYEPSLEPQP